MSKAIWIILLVLIVGGGFYYLNGSGKETDMSEPMYKEEAVAQDTMMDDEKEDTVDEDTMEKEDAVMEDDDTVVIEVEGGAFYFDADEITVSEGDTIKIVFTSVDGTHDWVLDEFDAKTDVIQTGESAEVMFVASKAGTYEYYCSVGDHRAQGMVGTLIVEPVVAE